MSGTRNARGTYRDGFEEADPEERHARRRVVVEKLEDVHAAVGDHREANQEGYDGDGEGYVGAAVAQLAGKPVDHRRQKRCVIGGRRRRHDRKKGRCTR